MSHTRKCNSKHENQTKNVDEVNLQRTVLTIPEGSDEPQEINAVWINVNKCIEVTVVWFSLLLAALFILVFLMSSYKIEFVRFNSSYSFIKCAFILVRPHTSTCFAHFTCIWQSKMFPVICSELLLILTQSRRFFFFKKQIKLAKQTLRMLTLVHLQAVPCSTFFRSSIYVAVKPKTQAIYTKAL